MSDHEDRKERMELVDLPSSVSLLAVAAFRLSRRVKASVTRVLSHDTSLGLMSWRVLVGLSARDGQTQRALVEFARTEQAQMSRILRDMEVRGLITSKRSETDGRARNFFLTASGRAEYDAALPSVTALSVSIDAALSASEQVQFIAMCERIECAAEKKEAGLLHSGRPRKT